MDSLREHCRSRWMSLVKSKNTAPEISVRKVLFSRGFRYRLNDKRLPGKPDLVFPKYKAVLFIHGCFWHGHHCKQGRPPSSNEDFWEAKLRRNKERDMENIAGLMHLGWRVKVIWTCSLKNKSTLVSEDVINEIISFLKE